MRGWQCIINTIYQNSGKLPEFINVLIIFGICIMSLPVLLLSSFPCEVGGSLVVSPLDRCTTGARQKLEAREETSSHLSYSPNGRYHGIVIRTALIYDCLLSAKNFAWS